MTRSSTIKSGRRSRAALIASRPFYCFTAHSELSFAPECLDQRLPAGVIVIHDKNASWIAQTIAAEGLTMGKTTVYRKLRQWVYSVEKSPVGPSGICSG